MQPPTPPQREPIDLAHDDDNLVDERRVLLGLTALAIVGGLLVGLIGSAFRWLLAEGDQTRINLVDWAQRWPVLGILIPVTTAAVCVIFARYLVVRVPAAARQRCSAGRGCDARAS